MDILERRQGGTAPAPLYGRWKSPPLIDTLPHLVYNLRVRRRMQVMWINSACGTPHARHVPPVVCQYTQKDSYLSTSSNGGSEAGRVLNGRYALIGPVGGGGMAQVYKARDNVLGRVVAVKILREQYASDDQFVARFKREAQAAANLAHPNIVNVYDVGQDGDLYYIIMEYISGESLKELINRASPLPVDSAVSIAAQILSALEYAHRSGLIHRDIKPQNVLITRDGGVKVTDFGIAKSVSDLGVTEAGLALGTAHYFSPEQAKGERVVPQSDIYAVGVTLFEMLTGRLPFESDSVVGLAYKHISEPPVPPSELRPNIPHRLDVIVLKAMAKDPQVRFGSAMEMEKALRSIEASGQQATASIPVARPNVSGGGGRQTPRGTTRGKTQAGGQPTGPIRTGAFPAAAGAAAAAGASTRHMTSPLSAPSSMAMRPAPARVQASGTGCSAVGAVLIAIGVLAVAVVAALWAAPNLSHLFTESVVPSPTSTPIIPTATSTPTPLPPTLTPTSTPTLTPSPTSTPISVKVPKLVGLKIGDATALAKQAGFGIQELPRVDTPEWPEGVVFQQDPSPDAVYQQTKTIVVRVSNGPPPFKLPQLTNTDPNTAQATLETAGLKVVVAYEGSLNLPQGVVTRTDPPADSSVRPGDTIKLYISLGETAEVPNLKGMTLDLATQALQAKGLSLGAVTEVGRADVGNDIDSVPEGTVYSQDPAPGTQASKGGPVNIRLRRVGQ